MSEKPHVSDVDMSSQAADVQDGQPDGFAPKPVPVVGLNMNKKKRAYEREEALFHASSSQLLTTYHVRIAVQRVAIQKRILDSVFREDGQSTADDSAAKQ